MPVSSATPATAVDRCPRSNPLPAARLRRHFLSFSLPPSAFSLAAVTVLEAIQKSTDFLAKKNVDSPRLQTELLLAHLLKMPRMKLYLNFERALASAEVDQFRDLIKRRSLREPLQHITGSTSFCGYEMTVNRHVLVPRPETELLAEAGWSFLISRPAPATSAPAAKSCSNSAMARPPPSNTSLKPNTGTSTPSKTTTPSAPAFYSPPRPCKPAALRSLARLLVLTILRPRDSVLACGRPLPLLLSNVPP